MTASDALEESYAPSKKLLNLSAFLGTLTALSSFLALPLAKIITPTVFLPAAIALTSLSWLAPPRPLPHLARRPYIPTKQIHSHIIIIPFF